MVLSTYRGITIWRPPRSHHSRAGSAWVETKQLYDLRSEHADMDDRWVAACAAQSHAFLPNALHQSSVRFDQWQRLFCWLLFDRRVDWPLLPSKLQSLHSRGSTLSHKVSRFVQRWTCSHEVGWQFPPPPLLRSRYFSLCTLLCTHTHSHTNVASLNDLND